MKDSKVALFYFLKVNGNLHLDIQELKPVLILLTAPASTPRIKLHFHHIHTLNDPPFIKLYGESLAIRSIKQHFRLKITILSGTVLYYSYKSYCIPLK